MNRPKAYLLSIEMAVGMGLPMLCACLVIIALIGMLGSAWPIFVAWLAWAIAGWAGLIGFFRLFSVAMDAEAEFSPIVTLLLLTCGAMAWSIFAYIAYRGSNDLFAYLPLITYPVVFHYMYMARAHLGKAFNKSKQQGPSAGRR